MNHDRDLLRQARRSDLNTFIHSAFHTVVPGSAYSRNWHIEAMAHRLELCLVGEIKRLIITLPPRSLKSICASVAFPAWVLGRDPRRNIICASYSADLAAMLARGCRMVIESSWYRDAFPRTQLDPRKNTESEFQTTTGGFRLATSVGGVLTGRGSDIIIVDDPLKASDAYSDSAREKTNEWFRSTLTSRLNDKRNGVIIVVTQRLHVDDLVGHLLSTGEPWVHLNLPAIAESMESFDLGDGRVFTREIGEVLHPEREPLEVLESIKKAMGSLAFAAQYQQDPIPIDGGLIKWSWFRTYDTVPERKNGDLITQSWDTASKPGELNSYSVCTTWLRRGGSHYLLHVNRERVEYPKLKRAVVDLKRLYHADAVLIEDQGSGIQLIQDLRHEGLVYPISINPEGSKEMRMFGATAKIEAGAVLIPAAAPWLDTFRKELLQFPLSGHNDQVDSLSQYLNWAGGYRVSFDMARSIPSMVEQVWDVDVGLTRGLPPPWLSGS